MLNGFERLNGEIDPLPEHVDERQGCGQGRKINQSAPGPAIEQHLDHGQLDVQQIQDPRVTIRELLAYHRPVQNRPRDIYQLEEE